MQKLHSFGGSHLDRHLIDYETVELGDELDAAQTFSAQETGTDSVASVEAGAEPSTATGSSAESEGPAAEEPSAAAAAPAWTDDPAVRDFIAAEAEQIADARAEAKLNELLQQYAGSGEQQQQPFEDGNFDPNEYLNPLNDTFGQNLLETLQAFGSHIVQQAQAPFVQAQQHAQAQEADARLNDVIADTIARNGEIVSAEGENVGEAIRQRARQIMAQLEPRYGFSDRTAERAIEQAYQQEKQYREALGKAYHERQMNELRGLAGAPTQPATSAHGAPVHADAEDEREVAARWGL